MRKTLNLNFRLFNKDFIPWLHLFLKTSLPLRFLLVWSVSALINLTCFSIERKIFLTTFVSLSRSPPFRVFVLVSVSVLVLLLVLLVWSVSALINLLPRNARHPSHPLFDQHLKLLLIHITSSNALYTWYLSFLLHRQYYQVCALVIIITTTTFFDQSTRILFLLLRPSPIFGAVSDFQQQKN